ncbi:MULTISPECIES: sigma factor-like helix-turn-helix DNA-binding protein [unclassified Sphingomonas]|uniref:sigma factor-like helix-turn-helix DNA-binding protein n=1 Tax=unclassified Sphingomonas TaxID=196159 RepID=UPI002150A4D1|nr:MULTISPECIES: sigma-70 region 4 domain-containing protein [unclassified Sphingomonas]MCR5870362.1 hypothetical protein [Sphingomonas sp. J344]UUY01302.1 hypothetical protein LRS08_09885 [Sphingomonas sp. J315]
MAHHLPLPELLRRIDQALDTMEPLPYAVFERHRFSGLDYARIAIELGVSVDEVERALADAMFHINRSVEQGGL